MCPPISCCHQRLTRPLPTQVYHLVRLLLAFGANELQANQKALAEARLASLWDQVQCALQDRFHTSAAYALTLTECLTVQLLQADCCRRSLSGAVSLEEALAARPKLA